MTTTSTLQDRQITQYLGVVSSEVIIGANFIKDIAASLTDFFGGRSTTYENTLKQAKDAVMQEIMNDAAPGWGPMPSLELTWIMRPSGAGIC